MKFLLVAFVFAGSAYSQNAQFASFGNIQLSTVGASPPALLERSRGATSLRNMRFVGRVGGVSFEQVAKPVSGETKLIQDIGYAPDWPDGQRVWVMANNKWYNLDVYDWELSPIAKFADTEFTATVSLFGDGPDTQRYYYISYHPAFKDTLLGLRLLQADIVLIDPMDLAQLPRFGSAVVLGAGEPPAAANDNRSIGAIREIRELQERYPAQSWVFTDTQTTITFQMTDEIVVLRGKPYYHFWIGSHLSDMVQLSQLAEVLIGRAEDAQRLGNEQELDQIIRQLEVLEQRADEIQAIEEIAEPVTPLINAFRGNPELTENLNRHVFRAATRTAQITAFFRHVKNVQPSEWNDFLMEVANISVSPSVKTPVTWDKNQ